VVVAAIQAMLNFPNQNGPPAHRLRGLAQSRLLADAKKVVMDVVARQLAAKLNGMSIPRLLAQRYDLATPRPPFRKRHLLRLARDR